MRLAVGQRDLENGTYEVARRDTLTKEVVPMDEVVAKIEFLLEDIQKSIYQKARDFRDSHITKVDAYGEFKTILEEKGGFISAHWDGTLETENRIKEETKATIRCVPIDNEREAGLCMVTGKPSERRVLFAKAY